MRQLPLVEDAMGYQTLTLLRKLDAACTSADGLAEAAVKAFETHPDASIITSFPGLGSLTGARVLAEIGDDRSRLVDAGALKSYAGAAPVMRASDKCISVKARRIKNQRLAAAGYVWAFASLTASTGARAQYDCRRTNGETHRSPAQSLQPHDRVPAPLPRQTRPLRRNHRLLHPCRARPHRRSLTA
jgi:transposase